MKPLIDRPEDLTPSTPWSATKWAWTAEEALVDHRTKARLCSAVLLPFQNGQPDWKSFVSEIRWQKAAADHYGVELVPVVPAQSTGHMRPNASVADPRFQGNRCGFFGLNIKCDWDGKPCRRAGPCRRALVNSNGITYPV